MSAYKVLSLALVAAILTTAFALAPPWPGEIASHAKDRTPLLRIWSVLILGEFKGYLCNPK